MVSIEINKVFISMIFNIRVIMLNKHCNMHDFFKKAFIRTLYICHNIIYIHVHTKHVYIIMSSLRVSYSCI